MQCLAITTKLRFANDDDGDYDDAIAAAAVYLPVFVTIISFVLLLNSVQSDLSSKVALREPDVGL